MIDLSDEQSTKDGSISVGPASSSASRPVMVEPGMGCMSVDPEGETTTPDESFVILLPVADAVLLLFLFSHASRLAEVSPPQLFVQQRQGRSNNSLNRSANNAAFIRQLEGLVSCLRARLIRALDVFVIMEIRNTEGQIIFVCEGNLQQADLDDVDLSGAMLERASLSPVVWCGTNLSRANLKGADLYWAILYTSNLRGADLEGADLRGADLKEVDFSGANLRDANFGRDMLGGSTQLQGANLSGAQIQAAKFDGAEYDGQTVFPESFDPMEHGMVFRIVDLSPYMPDI